MTFTVCNISPSDKKLLERSRADFREAAKSAMIPSDKLKKMKKGESSPLERAHA